MSWSRNRKRKRMGKAKRTGKRNDERTYET